MVNRVKTDIIVLGTQLNQIYFSLIYEVCKHSYLHFFRIPD